MKNVKVKCLIKGYAGSKMSLPIVGTVDLDENGEVEVAEDVAKAICENKEWELSEPEAPSQEELERKEEMMQLIDGMGLEEMAEFAKEAKIQGYEKFTKNEKAFKTFLKKRI